MNRITDSPNLNSGCLYSFASAIVSCGLDGITCYSSLMLMIHSREAGESHRFTLHESRPPNSVMPCHAISDRHPMLPRTCISLLHFHMV
ncbi:hypothetical protein C4D60_Mb01t07970 [Musa balbisiana]|uniref:Uncharacterized protein n=1 Tax=Musa balbisiana TaxID=52838 RepID=A0A4S8JKY4_MUSBA|nr:hypothetical protein C4D60_Mb01t07970 [Musa balbisiana]